MTMDYRCNKNDQEVCFCFANILFTVASHYSYRVFAGLCEILAIWLLWLIWFLSGFFFFGCRLVPIDETVECCSEFPQMPRRYNCSAHGCIWSARPKQHKLQQKSVMNTEADDGVFHLKRDKLFLKNHFRL